MAKRVSDGPMVGDNSYGAVDADALDSYVRRAASVMQDQKALADDLKEICDEADEAGVATKREIRRLARESLMDQDVLQAQLERMDLLRHSLGMFADTDLGRAAVEREEVAPAPRRRRRNNVESLEAARAHLSGEENIPPIVA